MNNEQRTMNYQPSTPLTISSQFISKTQLKPWYWRSLPLEGRTGSVVFAALFHRSTSAVATLLESPYPTPSDQPQLARYSICAGAPRVVNGCPQLWTPPIGEVLPFLRHLLERSSNQPSALSSQLSDEAKSLPFTGGWLGWLGYDFAWEIERLPRLKSEELPFPVAFWYEPECFAVLDHWKQILWLATTEPEQLDSLQKRLEGGAGELLSRGARAQGGRGALSGAGGLLSRGAEENVSAERVPMQSSTSLSPLLPIAPAPHLKNSRFLTSQADYEAAVCRAKKYIQAGDIFQANLSLRFEAHTPASGWTIYRALQQINPSPFASYWQTPWGTVISCSPERLVQLKRRQATTRPIAGTRSRGATPACDQQLAQELIANAKERAEHIMLVDLERNDLGRVCEWGSVAVNELLTIERYSHVMHLVSNITGTLRFDGNAVDLIRAMFPGGTITGCPKIRCMEIIEELEPVRRSLFYGSCGYLDWRGHLDLNILIRTLLLAPSSSQDAPDGTSKVWGQVGAGIVADSAPEREWYESLHKAQAQLAALNKAVG